MEQIKTQTHQQINIQLKADGELNLSGLTQQNLSYEEYLLVQQLIDESRQRSHNTSKVAELMQRGMMAQTVIAALAVLMFSFIGIYGVTRYIGSQVQQFQNSGVRSQESGVRSQNEF